MKPTEKKGWTRQVPLGPDECHPGQVSAEFWSWVQRTDIDTPEERAGRVAKYSGWLADAEQAERDGHLTKLKSIADLVRIAVGELPEGTPKYFYADKLRWLDSLTVEEIRDRINADIQRRGLVELFMLAENFRKTGTIQ